MASILKWLFLKLIMGIMVQKLKADTGEKLVLSQPCSFPAVFTLALSSAEEASAWVPVQESRGSCLCASLCVCGWGEAEFSFSPEFLA